ncbi:MAG: hypothetical protein EBS55_13915, partial [Flavobacteriaceae bacterium]|nr:hypothetical protein [Flavobacteriaceae bacterium]
HQKNLLTYATQQTSGGFTGQNGGELSLFALRNKENPILQEYAESKQKALDLYFGGIAAQKDKYTQEEQIRLQMEEQKKREKEQQKKMVKGIITSIVSSVAMAGVSYLGNTMATGAGNAIKAAELSSGNKLSGFDKFTTGLSGIFTGGTIQGEGGSSFNAGGLANLFNSNATQNFDIIGAPGGGLQQYNSKIGGYEKMQPQDFAKMFPYGASYNQVGIPTANKAYKNIIPLAWDSTNKEFTGLGSKSIGENITSAITQSIIKTPSIGRSLSKAQVGNVNYEIKSNDQDYSSIGALRVFQDNESSIDTLDYLRNNVDSSRELEFSDLIEKGFKNKNNIKRKAVGGYIAGNGMGDNVPALLTAGEFVMSKQASQNIGYGNLQKMNSSAKGESSDEMAIKIESKLEELFQKLAG